MKTNPEAWTIVEGRLYIVAGSREDIAEWKADAGESIEQGEKDPRRDSQPRTAPIHKANLNVGDSPAGYIGCIDEPAILAQVPAGT